MWLGAGHQPEQKVQSGRGLRAPAAGGGARRAAAAPSTHRLARWWGWARRPWASSACRPWPACAACNGSQGLASVCGHNPALATPRLGVPAAGSVVPAAHQYSHMLPAAVQALRSSTECPSRACETCWHRMRQLAELQKTEKPPIAGNAAMCVMSTGNVSHGRHVVLPCWRSVAAHLPLPLQVALLPTLRSNIHLRLHCGDIRTAPMLLHTAAYCTGPLCHRPHFASPGWQLAANCLPAQVAHHKKQCGRAGKNEGMKGYAQNSGIYNLVLAQRPRR